MWDLAVREDDYVAVDSMLARFSGAPLSYRIPPAHARRDAAAIARLHEEARNLDARQSQIAARYLATYHGDLAAAESLARLDLQPRRNGAIRLGAQTLLAWLAVARNDWPSASAAFGEAMRMEGGDAVLPERALAATLPFVSVSRNDLMAIRSEVAAWQPSSTTTAARGSVLLGPALEPHLRLYLMGLLSSRLGDGDAAMARARELDALPVPERGRAVVRALAATIRADVVLRQGQPARALDLLGAATGEVPLELVVVRPFVGARYFTQEHARWLRAEALRSLGRAPEAARVYATSFQGSAMELAYRAAVRERVTEVTGRR